MVLNKSLINNQTTDINSKNFILLEKHSIDCINNFRKLPEVKQVLKEHEEFLNKVNNYLEEITFL